jgi:hypothetical protein
MKKKTLLRSWQAKLKKLFNDNVAPHYGELGIRADGNNSSHVCGYVYTSSIVSVQSY